MRSPLKDLMIASASSPKLSPHHWRWHPSLMFLALQMIQFDVLALNKYQFQLMVGSWLHWKYQKINSWNILWQLSDCYSIFEFDFVHVPQNENSATNISFHYRNPNIRKLEEMMSKTFYEFHLIARFMGCTLILFCMYSEWGNFLKTGWGT